MTDFFALLQQPRQPALDLDALQKYFHQVSAESHPDRVHAADAPAKQSAQDRYTQLNGAYQQLRDREGRLRHLLELELGRKPADVQRVPAATMDLSLRVGGLCRAVDAFLLERSANVSPMVRMQFFARGLEWSDQLMALQRELQLQTQPLEDELRAMNAVWHAAPPAGSPARAAALPLERLEQLHRLGSYLSKWNAQLQERIVSLAL